MPERSPAACPQTFLGLRIECAQCHHHPNDVWSQTDYFGMQSFFTQVTYKGTPRGELIFTAGDPQTRHPRSGEVVFPHALGTEMPESAPQGDRRRHLADWLVNDSNPWFAKNVANRMWAHLMGRGLIEPVDDLRATNPATNPELLDALSQHFVSTGYDLKELIRTITASRAYQLTAIPNETNRNDEQSYSRAILRPLEAEVLPRRCQSGHRRGREVRGDPGRLSSDPALGQQPLALFLEGVRPSGAKIRLCLRAHPGRERRAGASFAEFSSNSG